MKKFIFIFIFLTTIILNSKAQQFQLHQSNVTLKNPFTEQPSKACDTLKHCDWSDSFTYVPLDSPAWGYLTGNNSYNIKKFADKFNTTSAHTISTILFANGSAISGAPGNSITFKIFPSVGGVPGATALGTSNPIPIDGLASNSIGGADFPTPVTVNGDFFVEYEVNANVVGAQDTFFLYLKDGGSDPALNTAYMNYNNAWVLLSASIIGNPNLAFAIQVIKCTVDGIETQDFSNGIKLSQNAPNPATGTTMIAYEIQNNSNVFLEIYDISGKKIIDADEGNKTAGKHYIMFDSNKLSKGVYYYTLVANGERFSRKMIIE